MVAEAASAADGLHQGRVRVGLGTAPGRTAAVTDHQHSVICPGARQELQPSATSRATAAGREGQYQIYARCKDNGFANNLLQQPAQHAAERQAAEAPRAPASS